MTPETADSASGLASAYQTTQLTGVGVAAVPDTAWRLRIGVVVLPYRETIFPAAPALEPMLPSEAAGNLVGEQDPAHMPFAGPLGAAASHAELAAAFARRAPSSPEPAGFVPLPDDLS
jgi:hypothetical protein